MPCPVPWCPVQACPVRWPGAVRCWPALVRCPVHGADTASSAGPPGQATPTYQGTKSSALVPCRRAVQVPPSRGPWTTPRPLAPGTPPRRGFWGDPKTALDFGPPGQRKTPAPRCGAGAARWDLRVPAVVGGPGQGPHTLGQVASRGPPAVTGGVAAAGNDLKVVGYALLVLGVQLGLRGPRGNGHN